MVENGAVISESVQNCAVILKLKFEIFAKGKLQNNFSSKYLLIFCGVTYYTENECTSLFECTLA